MLFDFHTHNHETESLAIVNCSLNDDFSRYPRFSVGLHPWDVDENWRENLEAYCHLIKHPPFEGFRKQMAAYGEIGVDKVRGGDLQMQIECFQEQLVLADTYGLPVIIHCVKAYDEVLRCLRDILSSHPHTVVFHGFRGKPEQASQLLRWNYGYLSFGPRFNPDSLKLAYEAGRMFLETDDSGMSIGDVYSLAAKALNISPADIVVPGIFKL